MLHKKIAIAGNYFGIRQLLKTLPLKNIKVMIVPYNRADSINYVKLISLYYKIPYLVHPKNNSVEYFQFLEKLSKYNCNLLVSNSYPLIFKASFLEIFNFNAFNIHASLLPKNRGCDPIHWAIMKDEKLTGVTIHQIDNNVDTGNIIAQNTVEINFTDTWVLLSEKIQIAKFKLIKEILPMLLTDNLLLEKQDNNISSYNNTISEKDLEINCVKMSHLQIYNLIRANISPSNPAYILKNDKKIYYKNFVKFDDLHYIIK